MYCPHKPSFLLWLLFKSTLLLAIKKKKSVSFVFYENILTMFSSNFVLVVSKHNFWHSKFYSVVPNTVFSAPHLVLGLEIFTMSVYPPVLRIFQHLLHLLDCFIFHIPSWSYLLPLARVQKWTKSAHKCIHS